MEFLTQIHTAWDGTEQRAGLRPVPRRSISYEYIGVKTWQSQYLRALTYSQQTQLLQFPLWHATTSLSRNAYVGDTTLHIPIDRLWGSRDAGAIMTWKDDDVGGTVLPLNTIASDGTLGLSKMLKENCRVGVTVITPIVWGVLRQEDKYINMHSTLTTMQINVELIANQGAPGFPAAMDEYHNEPVPQPWGTGLPATYQGAEVFLTPPPWTDNMNANFTRNANRLDNQSGIFQYDLKSTDPSETKEIEYVTTSRKEISNLQRFFCRCKGRLKSFRAPTWLSDVELAEDAPAGQSYLLARWPLYWKYYANGQRRKTLVAFMRGGSGRLLKIAGYAMDETGQRGKIYLDDPLTMPLRREDVAMLSYLCRYRLGSDTLVTDYESVDVATMDISMIEVSE